MIEWWEQCGFAFSFSKFFSLARPARARNGWSILRSAPAIASEY